MLTLIVRGSIAAQGSYGYFNNTLVIAANDAKNLELAINVASYDIGLANLVVIQHPVSLNHCFLPAEVFGKSMDYQAVSYKAQSTIYDWAKAVAGPEMNLDEYFGGLSPHLSLIRLTSPEDLAMLTLFRHLIEEDVITPKMVAQRMAKITKVYGQFAYGLGVEAWIRRFGQEYAKKLAVLHGVYVEMLRFEYKEAADC